LKAQAEPVDDAKNFANLRCLLPPLQFPEESGSCSAERRRVGLGEPVRPPLGPDGVSEVFWRQNRPKQDILALHDLSSI
jgi:hypothetical protein